GWWAIGRSRLEMMRTSDPGSHSLCLRSRHCSGHSRNGTQCVAATVAWQAARRTADTTRSRDDKSPAAGGALLCVGPGSEQAWCWCRSCFAGRSRVGDGVPPAGDGVAHGQGALGAGASAGGCAVSSRAAEGHGGAQVRALGGGGHVLLVDAHAQWFVAPVFGDGVVHVVAVREQ